MTSLGDVIWVANSSAEDLCHQKKRTLRGMKAPPAGGSGRQDHHPYPAPGGGGSPGELHCAPAPQVDRGRRHH